MHKNASRLTAVTLSLFILLSSANLMASEKIELTAQDVKTNLQAFRNDGKFTVTLIRYHGCKPCDEAEIDLQQWYDQLDGQEVSALIINIDDVEQHDAVRTRQSNAGIDITSYFAKSTPRFRDGLEEITGKSFKAVPLYIFFGPDGEFIGERMGNGVDWQQLNEIIANR